MTKFVLAVIILSTVLLSGCVLEGGSNVNSGPAATAVEANNRFAFDLYSQYKSEAGNVFFSPYSISTALAMTSEGARGKTAEEMSAVLHLPEDKVAYRKSVLGVYNQINKKDKKYQLSTANALWAQKDYSFLDEYFSLVDNYYKGKVTNLDFAGDAEGSRITINDWVEEQTNDKIKDLIPPIAITPLTKLVLTNAVYFKGEWNESFNKEDTKKADFKIDSRDTVEVDMMERTDEDSYFNYSETDDLQILEMPYTGNDLSMLILLPKENDLNNVEEKLDASTLSNWKKNLTKQRVDVYIPKFKFETKYEMSDTLKKMGMPTAFSGKANFSGMTGRSDLYISAVIHQAFVEVNEEGTEAAAATAVVMYDKIVIIDEPQIPVFRADHPFIFIIQQKDTGNILFIGRVSNPSI